MKWPAPHLRRIVCAALLAVLAACGGGGPGEESDAVFSQIFITNNSDLYWDTFIFRDAERDDAPWRFIGTGLPWTGFPPRGACSIGDAVPPGAELHPFREGILRGQEITVDIMAYSRCRPPCSRSIDPRRCHTLTRTWNNVSLELDEDTELVIN